MPKLAIQIIIGTGDTKEDITQAMHDPKTISQLRQLEKILTPLIKNKGGEIKLSIVD